MTRKVEVYKIRYHIKTIWKEEYPEEKYEPAKERIFIFQKYECEQEGYSCKNDIPEESYEREIVYAHPNETEEYTEGKQWEKGIP